MRAKDELGIEVAFSEKVAQPDQAEAMADYARRGYNIVIGHGGEFQEAANRVASRTSRDHVRRQQRHRAGRRTSPPRTSTTGSSATSGLSRRQDERRPARAGLIGAQKIKFSHRPAGELRRRVSRRRGRKARCSSPGPTTGTTSPRARKRRSIRSTRGPTSSSRPWTTPRSAACRRPRTTACGRFGLYYDAIADWPDTVLQSAIFDISGAMVSYLDQAKGAGLEGKNYKYSLSTPEAARMGSYPSGDPGRWSPRRSRTWLAQMERAGSSPESHQAAGPGRSGPAPAARIATLDHVVVDRVTKAFGAFKALDGVTLQHPQGLDPCGARRERRGQDDPDERALRALPARRGHDPDRWPRGRDPVAAGRDRARHRHDPPAFHAGELPDGHRERRARARGPGRRARPALRHAGRIAELGRELRLRDRSRGPGLAAADRACGSGSRSSRRSTAMPRS